MSDPRLVAVAAKLGAPPEQVGLVASAHVAGLLFVELAEALEAAMAANSFSQVDLRARPKPKR